MAVNEFNAENIKDTTLEYRPVSQTLWEQFIDFCFGNGPGGQVAGIVQHKTVSLTTDQIKTGFSIPIDAGLPLPGVGKAYEVISGSWKYVKATTDFTTTEVNIVTDTLPVTQQQAQTRFQNPFALGSFFGRFGITNPFGDALKENKKLLIQTNADSVTGDGTGKVYFSYRIITL